MGNGFLDIFTQKASCRFIDIMIQAKIRYKQNLKYVFKLIFNIFKKKLGLDFKIVLCLFDFKSAATLNL